jgi:hypothetical protein
MNLNPSATGSTGMKKCRICYCQLNQCHGVACLLLICTSIVRALLGACGSSRSNVMHSRTLEVAEWQKPPLVSRTNGLEFKAFLFCLSNRHARAFVICLQQSWLWLGQWRQNVDSNEQGKLLLLNTTQNLRMYRLHAYGRQVILKYCMIPGGYQERRHQESE